MPFAHLGHPYHNINKLVPTMASIGMGLVTVTASSGSGSGSACVHGGRLQKWTNYVVVHKVIGNL